MARKQVMFTFPEELVQQPLIYNLGRRFGVITNIRRADVSDKRGWVVLELEGNERDIEEGIAWVTGLGVQVDPVTGDIMEG